MRSKPASSPAPAPRRHFGKILTAKDFSSMGLKPSAKSSSSLSSSSSSSSAIKANFSAGTKRSADHSVSPPANRCASQVVGWPPVGTHRMNSLVNQAKSPAIQDFDSAAVRSKSTNALVDVTTNGGNGNTAMGKGQARTLLVKINMDGDPIGRKVDLNAHICYETLAQTLEDMFFRSPAIIDAKRSSTGEHHVLTEAAGPSRLLGESSEFVLAYEDKDGDCMKVGDVPWGMFISSVKRLRIMRKPVTTGLGFQERNGRQ